jgi:hypothetical protein
MLSLVFEHLFTSNTTDLNFISCIVSVELLAELGIDEIVDSHNNSIFTLHIVEFVGRVVCRPGVDLRDHLSSFLPHKIFIAHLLLNHVKVLLLDLKLLLFLAILNRKSRLLLLQLVIQLLLQNIGFLLD